MSLVDHVIDHMVDHMIIGLITTALHLTLQTKLV